MFSFSTAGKIRFGAGVFDELPALVAGHRVLLVTGSNPDRLPLPPELRDTPAFRVAGEPSFELAREAVELCRASGADLIVAIGGGAVLDLAKAVSVLAPPQGGDPLDYAEVIGGGLPIGDEKVRTIAIPTTAGAGAEVTANAVLNSTEHGVKVSLRAAAILPDLALVDPALTLSTPPAVTAHSGMDALTQCIEPFTSPAANPLTDALAAEGLRRARALPVAFSQPEDLPARTDMSLCALLGGMSLANAKLGAVHGLAGVLGGLTGAPHGAICAALLAPVTSANLSALFARDPNSPSIDRYRVAGELLTGVRHTTALQEWLFELTRHLELQGLAALGLAPDQFDAVIAGANRASSMKGNPIVLGDDELIGVLETAM